MTSVRALMLRVAGSSEPELRRSWKWSTVASVLQAFAYGLLVPLIVALASDPIESEQTWWVVLAISLTVLLQAAAQRQVLSFSHEQMATIASELRMEVGEHLREMPLEDLNRRMSGDLSTVVGENVANATLGLTSIGSLLFEMVAIPAVLVLVLPLVDWRLLLVVSPLLPLGWLALNRFRARTNEGLKHIATADADAAAKLVEFAQALPILKAAGAAGTTEGSEHSAMASFARQTKIMKHTQRRATAPTMTMMAIVQLAVIGIVAVGAMLALDDQITQATAVAVTVLAFRMADPMALASVMTIMFDLMDAGVSRIDEILAIPPLSMPQKDTKPQHFEVTFKDVDFTYSEAADPALRNLSMTVPERSLVALVGPSGGGKTTVTKLITRYADPQRGSVSIGGVDVRQMTTKTLMTQVSVVFQDVYLFDDTIIANISMARPDASESEIHAAATAANCDEFIGRFPDGYHTRVGEIGGALSGGERQRISIARAILKDAPIVILDEPTAALDSQSEVAVQNAIERLILDRTVLVIAHRLSTVVNADLIVVLNNGKIIEQGQHADLLARNGAYSRMWRAQIQARSWNTSRASD